MQHDFSAGVSSPGLLSRFTEHGICMYTYDLFILNLCYHIERPTQQLTTYKALFKNFQVVVFQEENNFYPRAFIHWIRREVAMQKISVRNFRGESMHIESDAKFLT